MDSVEDIEQISFLWGRAEGQSDFKEKFRKILFSSLKYKPKVEKLQELFKEGVEK